MMTRRLLAVLAPVIAADGTFTWSRKTGKRVNVRFTDAGGEIASNRVVVPAS